MHLASVCFVTDSATEQILAGLNTEQRQAVTSPAETLVIRAGAGSGKTRVLTPVSYTHLTLPTIYSV